MSFIFQVQDYGQAFEGLLTDRLNELGPGTPDEAARSLLSGLHATDLFEGQSIADVGAADCCLSGLWLLHDYLDESHSVSQNIATSNGSYWHGIMHRRECDYSNAKYWFRRVGDHPIFGALASAAEDLAEAAGEHSNFHSPQWDPYAFIDQCAANEGSGTPQEMLCRKIARAEWQLLFDYCYRKAIGRN